MHKAYLHHLKQPCKNRGLSLVIENDMPIIGGKKFDTYGDIERYLESMPRIDIPQQRPGNGAQ